VIRCDRFIADVTGVCNRARSPRNVRAAVPSQLPGESNRAIQAKQTELEYDPMSSEGNSAVDSAWCRVADTLQPLAAAAAAAAEQRRSSSSSSSNSGLSQAQINSLVKVADDMDEALGRSSGLASSALGRGVPQMLFETVSRSSRNTVSYRAHIYFRGHSRSQQLLPWLCTQQMCCERKCCVHTGQAASTKRHVKAFHKDRALHSCAMGNIC
jgi:hypothetical protein